MESEEENEQRRFGQERKERRRGEGEERIISTREKHKHKNMHRSDAQRGTKETAVRSRITFRGFEPGTSQRQRISRVIKSLVFQVSSTTVSEGEEKGGWPAVGWWVRRERRSQGKRKKEVCTAGVTAGVTVFPGGCEVRLFFRVVVSVVFFSDPPTREGVGDRVKTWRRRNDRTLYITPFSHLYSPPSLRFSSPFYLRPSRGKTVENWGAAPDPAPGGGPFF